MKNVEECQKVFEQLSDTLGLKILGWRRVPVNSSIIGPAAKSKEPAAYFERQLFVLSKHATHTLTMKNWFYICSLSNKNIVYKGQLTPKQVYLYYYDLMNVQYTTHLALVHSRFSTNTFPSWDRAQPMRWSAHNGNVLQKKKKKKKLVGIIY
jgi:glutamate synthase (NADPH/NADH)